MYSSMVIQANWMQYPHWLSPSSVPFFEWLFCIMWSFVYDQALQSLRARGLSRFTGPHFRLCIGLGITSAAMLYFGGLQEVIDRNARSSSDHVYTSSVSIWWQIPGMCLIALSSVMVLAGGLEYAFAMSPKSMKAVVLSLAVVAAGNGNAVSIALSPLITEEYLKWTYIALAIIQAIAAMAYYALFRKYDVSYAALVETPPADDEEIVCDTSTEKDRKFE
eukprot:Nk52_evm13s312 gene=Nk52_evmTU13s312